MSKAEIIERERRWATPAGITGILAVVLFAASLVLLATDYGAENDAELLRKIDADSGNYILAYVIRAIGSLLLIVPLLYLFLAAEARSDGMRRQFVGLVIAAPIFLAGLAIFTSLSLKDAAPDFVAQGIAGNGERADRVAENVIEDSSLRGLATGFGFAGAIGFAFAMAYTCYHSLKVGLLTRFWGSLGAALGVASIIFFQYTLLWIAYLGLLIGGWTPRGRPPAWAAGEAVPWPTPGEQAADSLRPEEQGDEGGGGEGEAEPAGEPANPPRQRGERRKRKRRQGDGG